VTYSELSPADLFRACGQVGDAACWQEFMRRFNPVIARSILRIALRYGVSENSVIDDLIQDTYLKICANDRQLLRAFSPQHEDSAFGFLKVVSTRVAQDFFKSRLVEKRALEPNTEALEEGGVPVCQEAGSNKLSATEKAVLIDEIDRTLVRLIPACDVERARRVFWLYYRAGFTANSIASIPALGLTTKGVESLLFRLTRAVRESLCEKTKGAAPGEKGFQQAESF
jgi:RNA polymerase sigma-70 factor (ECF subfamily)